MDELPEARDCLQRALAIRETKLTGGKDHPLTALTLNSLGEVLSRLGDFETGGQYLRRAWKIRKESLGADSPVVVSSLFDLGVLELRQGHFSVAQAHFAEALEKSLEIAADVVPSLSEAESLAYLRKILGQRDALLLAIREQGTTLAADKTPADRLLRRLVWEKVEPHLSACSTLIVIPDGALTRVPWAALPGPQEGAYLVEQYAIAVASHGQQLLQWLERPSPPPASLLLVGAVAYDGKLAAPAKRSEITRRPVDSWSSRAGRRPRRLSANRCRTSPACTWRRTVSSPIPHSVPCFSTTRRANGC